MRASWPWKDSFVFVQKLPEPLAKQSQLFQTIMTACCVSGCKNRYSSQCEIKFHRIPSTWGPFRANRRRLWIKAIEEANGSVLQLKPNICICGAHFISGKCINRFFFIKQLAGSLTEYSRMKILFLHENINFIFISQGRHLWITTIQTLYLLYSPKLKRSQFLRKMRNGKKTKYVNCMFQARCNIFA